MCFLYEGMEYPHAVAIYTSLDSDGLRTQADQTGDQRHYLERIVVFLVLLELLKLRSEMDWGFKFHIKKAGE